MKRYQMWSVWVYKREGRGDKWPAGGSACFKWAQEHHGGEDPPAPVHSQMLDLWKDARERSGYAGPEGEPELTSNAKTIIGKSEDGLLGFIANRGHSNLGWPVW
jgi:hypothetical protein